MTGIGCHWLEFLLEAQQVIPAHEPKDAFMVNRIAAILEFCRDPPITIAWKFQSDLLNLVLQIHIIANRRWVHFRLFQPIVVAAAAHFERPTGLGY